MRPLMNKTHQSQTLSSRITIKTEAAGYLFDSRRSAACSLRASQI